MGINVKYRVTGLLLFAAFYLTCGSLISQEVQDKPSRQGALDAFAKGNYEKAFSEFNLLLETYSRDPLYRYYLGVCLVKMNRQPENARVFLQDALNGSLDIKSIPDDAWFYLGRAQQMSGKFTEAIKSYSVFESKAGKKQAREYNVPELIQECNEGKGIIKNTDFQHAERMISTDPGNKESVQRTAEEKSVETAASKPAPQKESLPVEYDRVLSQAMDYQVKADSLNSMAAVYRKELDRLPASQQEAVRKKISEAQSLALEYQKLADEKFRDNNSRKAKDKPVVQSPVADTKSESKVYSMFSVETNSGIIREQKISIDPELPEGLIYRIQMGVFSNTPDPSFFKGINPVSGFRIPGTEAIRYFAGMFRKLADANRALLTMKQMGFKDSFITAILDGKQVSIERASLLENEWSQKTLMKNSLPKKSEGTIVSTLVFRVEVTRSVKPAADDITEAYKRIAGNRGFEIIRAEDGEYVYLIGKFITFESASEYAGLLNRNGYRDAKVSAYAGSIEIPVETAKELFERQK